MKKYLTNSQSKIDEYDNLNNEINKKVDELREKSSKLYNELNNIQNLFDKIRRTTNTKRVEYEQIKKFSLEWNQIVRIIEERKSYELIKNTSVGAVGIGAGVAIAMLTPKEIKTTSERRVIVNGIISPSHLKPLGIALVTFASALLFLFFMKRKKLMKISDNYYSIRIKLSELALIELNERILRVCNETKILKDVGIVIESFGTDYDMMTEKQQYKLGTYLNLMYSSTQLLINPIVNLQKKFSEKEFNNFLAWKGRKSDEKLCNNYKLLIISLANEMYKLDLKDKDKKLLFKIYRKNKSFLSEFNINKKQFTYDIFNAVFEALSYTYK